MAKLYLGSSLISGGGGGVEVTVTPSASSVDEGASVTFTIATAPAQAAAQVLWRLTGVSAADVVGGLLAGVATTNGSGVATVAVEMVNDSVAEGEETMTLSAGMLAGSGAVTVNDTSSAISARYWRVNGIILGAGGSQLEISELQLFANGIQQTGATVTASSAPALALSNLVDGNLSSRCYWDNSTAEGSGFWIKFDFGAANDKAINGVKQGGFDTNDRYMAAFSLQYSSNDSTWTTLGSKSGLAYPGNNTLSSLYSFP
jgi:hypothetical protein